MGTNPVSADWSWHVGTYASCSARNTASLIPERTQEASDNDLDWIVISGESSEGYYPGLRVISQELDLNFPRLTPILATGWRAPKALSDSLTILGVDPRAPIPRETNRILDWVDAQSGIAIHQNPILSATTTQTRHSVLFSGISNGDWHPSIEVDAGWDKLLTAGHRVLITGGFDRRESSQKVYVWADENRTQNIINAIRKGATYVVEGGGPQMDFRVNGKTVGSSVTLQRDAYISIRAASESLITRVLLVSDGEIVWDASPGKHVWEERFFLPLSNRQYIRPIVECGDAGHRAVGNPVFLESTPEVDVSVLPLGVSDGLLPEPIYPEIDGALEVVANLGQIAQKRVLAELLRDESVIHDAVRVLEVREDLIPDSVLGELATDPNPQVRLGSAYALVVRNPPELQEFLQRLLIDQDIRIREYGSRMLSQFVGSLDANQWGVEIWGSPPFVKSYLIRSLAADLSNVSLTGKLINTCRSPHPSVSAASVDKLVELGTKSYRVIKALLDSSREGNVAALEPVGLIGDRRCINALEKIFGSQEHGPLKRGSFDVLTKMGAPYPDRMTAQCRYISAPVVVDGTVDSTEWSHADPMGPFKQDQDASPTDIQISGRFLWDDTYLYMLAAFRDRPGRKPAVHLRSHDDPGFVVDDHFEWSFGTLGGRAAPKVIAVNLLGVTQDRIGSDPTWAPHWRAAVGRTSNGWNIECRIRLDSLEIDNVDPLPIRTNLSLVSGKNRERMTWSVTYASPENPDRFGDLVFEALPPHSEDARE